MTQLKHQHENRAFTEMMKVAKGWLAGREPLKIAEKTGIIYDKENSRFYVTSLGTGICIYYPDYKITPYVNEWHQLVILHYMRLADGMPLTGKWISMGEVKDGLIRGGDFDRRCENLIRCCSSQIVTKEFEKQCLNLGGRIIESNADLAVQFDFLPYCPLLLKLWFADEEFPASGKLLLDASADHYLMIEDAVAVGEVILERIMGIV